MANVATTNIIWSDLGSSSGPPTSSYTGPYMIDRTNILKGQTIPASIPASVVTQWQQWGLVKSV
jgi:hypothetical protein